MPKTSLGKVSNSGSIQYTNAGAAITKTNFGKIKGNESSYDFYNSIEYQHNSQYQQLLKQKEQQIPQTYYYTNSYVNPYGTKYDINTFSM